MIFERRCHGNRQQPIEIVAHDRRLGRHRRHLAQLLDFAERLVARFLGELGRLDALLELGHLVATLLVPEFLLDRLHLLVEIILALRLLHLPLDAGADALLDLQDGDFALHQREALLEPFGDRAGLENRLLVRELDRQMGGDGVGELAVVVDLVDRADDLRRDLLVQLHIALEFGHDRTRQRLGLDLLDRLVRDSLRLRHEEGVARDVLAHNGARSAFDQHLDRAVGQLEKLQNARQRPGGEDGVGRRIVVGRVLLGGQQNRLVRLHHFFERANRLLATNEQRHDHMREDDDVAQRKDGIGVMCAWGDGFSLAGHSYPFRRPAQGRPPRLH